MFPGDPPMSVGMSNETPGIHEQVTVIRLSPLVAAQPTETISALVAHLVRSACAAPARAPRAEAKTVASDPHRR